MTPQGTCTYAATFPYEVVNIDGPRDAADVDDNVTIQYYAATSSYPGQVSSVTYGGKTVAYDAYSPLGGVLRWYDLNGGTVADRANPPALWQMTRDSADRPLVLTMPDGKLVQYGWSIYDGPVTVTAPLGNYTTYTRDDWGRMTLVGRWAAAGGAAIDTVAYNTLDARGLPASVETQVGGTTVAKYGLGFDFHGQLQQVTPFRDATSTLVNTASAWFFRSPEGVLLSTNDPLTAGIGATATSALLSANRQLDHDAFGEITTDTRVGAASGLLAAVVAITAMTYDAVGQLTQSQRSMDPSTSTSTSWSVDDFGRSVQTSSPEGGTYTYEYGKGGELKKRKDGNGVTLTYTTDARGRVTNIAYPTTPAETFVWDGTDDKGSGESVTDCITGAAVAQVYENGHLRKVTVADGSQTFYYGYTSRGQLAFEGRKLAGQTCVGLTYYLYDDNGNVSSIKYPVADPTSASSPRQIWYLRTGADPDAITGIDVRRGGVQVHLVDTVVAQANKLSYQALNTLAGDAVKNVTYTYAMNWDGTPSGITVARTADATKRLLNRQFVVDANGNPTIQKDLIIGAAQEQALPSNMYGNWTQAYSYDKLGHLTEAKGPMRDLLANLDWLGNQTGAVTSATPALTDIMAPFTAGASTSKTGYTYSATTHRLNDVNVYNMGLTPAYDGNGARTGLSGAMNLGPFVFDDAQRLTSWPLASGGPPVTVTNTVDYAARRWQTVQGSGSSAVTTRFWYGADGQLLAVESPQVNGCAGTGAGTVTVRSDFVYLFGRPVAVLHSSVGATAAECATNFIATNQLGTPLAVLDDAGTIASTPPDGHCEDVYRNQQLVTDPANMGTYNYGAPIDGVGMLEHLFLDVLPYWAWGNTWDDPVPLLGRLTGTP